MLLVGLTSGHTDDGPSLSRPCGKAECSKGDVEAGGESLWKQKTVEFVQEIIWAIWEGRKVFHVVTGKGCVCTCVGLCVTVIVCGMF